MAAPPTRNRQLGMSLVGGGCKEGGQGLLRGRGRLPELQNMVSQARAPPQRRAPAACCSYDSYITHMERSLPKYQFWVMFSVDTTSA